MAEADQMKVVDSRLPPVTINSQRGKFAAAMLDLWQGFTRVRIWRELAWERFVQRYRRAYLGIIWAMIGFIIFAFAIIFFRNAVAGGVSGLEIGHVLFGFLAFQFLSSIIIESSGVFVNARSMMESSPLPLSTYVFQSLGSNVLTFMFNCVGAALMLLVFRYTPPAGAYYVIPAIGALLVNAVWVYMLLGTVLARFRDGAMLVQNLMRMAIFLTPIMWVPVEGTWRGLIALINPLTHFIDIFRVPLVTGELPILAWQVVGAITLVGYLLALTTFTFFRRKIILWI